jgi:hypothetical protein
MSDSNRPRKNRLKGKFKGLLDRLAGAGRLHNEPLSGSKSEFKAPTLEDSILTRSRPTFTRALEVMGEGTYLVCVYNARITFSAHILCFGGPRM